MKNRFNFFKMTMPKSRKADYYLGCLNSSVFIDFNLSANNRISLVRISFDGYGCCNLDNKSESLNLEDSQEFMKEMEKESLDQDKIRRLVKELIIINKIHIWSDAVEEYGLIEKK